MLLVNNRNNEYEFRRIASTHLSKKMNSTWINMKTTYYLAKILGLLPFTGPHKCLSLLHMLALWCFLGVVSFYISFLTYDHTKNLQSNLSLVINVEYFFNFFFFILILRDVIL